MGWYLTMFSSMAYLWVVIALLFSAVVFCKGNWRQRAIRITGLCFILTIFFYYSNNGDKHPPDKTPRTLRMGFVNAKVNKSDVAAKVKYAYYNKLDVVGIVEGRTDFLEKLPKKVSNIRKKVYPYSAVTRLDYPVSAPYAMVLLSRFPIKVVDTFGDQMVLYHIKTPQGIMQLALINPWCPCSPKLYQGRNNFWKHVANYPFHKKLPLVIMGDFNTVPWDGALRKALKTLPVEFKGNWWPTFPSSNAIVPVDHILASPDITTFGVYRKIVASTDHMGSFIDMRLPKSKFK